VNTRAHLAHQDISRAHRLATENFYPAPLAIAVSAVARASTGFFMRHRSIPPLTYIDNFERRLPLAMTPQTAVAFSALHFEDDDLLCQALIDDLGGDFDIRQGRRADFHLAVAADEQHLAQRNLIAHLTLQPFHPNGLTGGCAVLFPARPENYVSHKFDYSLEQTL
jgi:hypothetical protein